MTRKIAFLHEVEAVTYIGYLMNGTLFFLQASNENFTVET